MKYDPKTTDATTIKALNGFGFPETAGKVCATDSVKAMLTTYQMTTNPGATSLIPDGKTMITAYCADSRIFKLAGLLSAATLVASSHLV